MYSINSKSIVFITGAFVSNVGWDEWQEYFKSKGFDTTAPAWPYKNGTAQELRNRQGRDTDLAKLTFTELVDHYAKIVKGMAEKPILIGHSLGGLITQILVNRGLPAAGIVIHPAPPLGVFPYEFSFLRGGWRALGLFTSTKKTYMMSFKKWQYAFANGMPLNEQRAAYEQIAIPESKTVTRGALTRAAKVDFSKSHPPLLIASGSNDNLLPAHLNYRNFKKYKKNDSILDYKEFYGRNHYVLGQKTWKEDAEYMYNWIENLSERKSDKEIYNKKLITKN